jgi:hypothetical protein
VSPDQIIALVGASGLKANAGNGFVMRSHLAAGRRLMKIAAADVSGSGRFGPNRLEPFSSRVSALIRNVPPAWRSTLGAWDLHLEHGI